MTWPLETGTEQQLLTWDLPHTEPKPDSWPLLGVSLLYLGWRHRDKPLSLTFSLEPGLESQKNKTSKGRSATTSTGAEGKPTKVKIHPGAEVTILQKLCWSLQVLTEAGISSDHLGEPETDLGQDFLTMQTSCHLPQFFLCLSLILMSVPLNTDTGVTRSLYLFLFPLWSIEYISLLFTITQWDKQPTQAWWDYWSLSFCTKNTVHNFSTYSTQKH